ncbi:MAG TPA: hypothetical protein H9700_01115 [Candidatus Eisenbergiella intestinipullorum]|nr:hypothetical protein [Candidatus Eisenbergiella intestinipullorum]
MKGTGETGKTILLAALIAAAVYAAAVGGIGRILPERSAWPEAAQGSAVGPETGQARAASVSPENAEDQPVCASPETEESLLSETEKGGYAFFTLGEEDRLLYEELLDAVTGFSQETVLSVRVQDADRLERIFSCVLADHPEIFYVDGYTLSVRTAGEEIRSISFQPSYTFSGQQAKERMERVRKAADAVLSGLAPEMDDYEKLKELYEAVILGTEYDLQAPENQTICSVFLYGRSVCQGYAKAFQYLCQRAGIPAVLVTGKTEDGSPHAWTAVRCSGAWYYADPAWGDVSYRKKDTEEGGAGTEDPPAGEDHAEDRMEQIDYDCFLVTAEEISRTHRADDTFLLPDCRSMADNYYVREGLYFTRADRAQVSAAFERAQQEGWRAVTLKCANESVYEELEESLLVSREIFRYLSRETVAYAAAKERLALTFFL